MTEPRNYRDDPRYQATHADYVDDERPGEDPDTVYIRRIEAALALRNIQREYQNRTDRP